MYLKNRVFICFFIIGTLLTQPVSAKVLFQPGQSTRSLGMGGTYIAFARGVDALYYNAAALARNEGFSFTLAEIQPAISTNAQRLADQSQGGGTATTAANLDALYGKTFSIDVNARSGFVFPYWGAGAYSTNYINESFSNPVFPTFNVEFISDYGYLVSGAVPIGPRTSLGLTGRHVKRWGGEQEILVSSLVGTTDQALIQSTFTDKGTGNAMDVSFLHSFDNDWSPSLAAVWYDLGNTKFNPTSGKGPPQQENNLVFGASAQRKIPLGTWTSSLEYKFVQQTGSLSKKIHLGTEVSLGLVDLRAGLYQGYVTYGAALDFSFLRIEAAAYTVELGNSAGQSPSERYQASISFNLDFDQAFKLSTKDGKKRRLMQRR